MKTTLAFLDLETDGLTDRARPWEIAVKLRHPSGGNGLSLHYMVEDPDLTDAETQALRYSRFAERHPILGRGPIGGDIVLQPERDIARRLFMLFHGVALVGANIAYDEQVLDRMFKRHGLTGNWFYRKVDVEAQLAALLGIADPADWGLGKLCKAAGLDVDDEQTHTAMYDAELAERAYYWVYANSPNLAVARDAG